MDNRGTSDRGLFYGGGGHGGYHNSAGAYANASSYGSYPPQQYPPSYCGSYSAAGYPSYPSPHHSAGSMLVGSHGYGHGYGHGHGHEHEHGNFGYGHHGGHGHSSGKFGHGYHGKFNHGYNHGNHHGFSGGKFNKWK